MEIILISIVTLIILVTLIAPKSMSYILWFVLLCYPHQINEPFVVPFGVGGDDLLIVVLFLSVAIRCILKGKLNFSTATRAALLFALVEMIADASGALTSPGMLANAYKNTLKGSVYVMFAFILDNTLDSEKELRRSLYFMMSAAAMGAITVIGQKYIGGMFQIFTPVVATEQTSVRGGGSFITPGGAGVVMMLMIILCICLLQIKPTYLNRAFVFTVLSACVGALGASIAGSGAAGLVVVLGTMVVMGRGRGTLLLVLGLGVLVGIAVAPFVFEEIVRKLTGPNVIPKLQGRFQIWMNVILNPSPFQLFCGRGMAAELIRLGETPHNGYLYHSFTLGLGGAIWAVWFHLQMFLKGRSLSRWPYSGPIAIGRCGMWLLPGLAVANITSIIWIVSFMRYLLLAIVAYNAALTAVAASAEEEYWSESEDLSEFTFPGAKDLLTDKGHLA